MAIPRHIEERILEAASRLGGQLRREVYRMLKSGMSMREVLDALSRFQVPPAHRQAFEEVLIRSMKEIAHAQTALQRASGPSTLSAADVDVLMSASDITLPEMRGGLTRYLRQELQRAISAGYGPEALRRRMERLGFGDMRTLAFTSLAQFNNNLTFRHSELSGTKRFLYSGPIAPVTRPFCRAHAGRIFTLAQIEQMDNGQGLPVRSSCGGYNCRHEWVAIPGSMSDKRAGGKSAPTATPVRIGKAVYMMDGGSRTELFKHDRTLWVEYQKNERNGADTGSWLTVARPIAQVHDSLNETITNTPSEGVWLPKHRSRNRSNFEYHVDKRLKENSISGANDFKLKMKRVMTDVDAEVHEFRTDEGDRMFMVHSARNAWDLMCDARGRIHSSYPYYAKMDSWDGSKQIGTLKDFIGRFR